MPVDRPSLDEESLRRYLRDLVAVSTLSAVWSRRDPQLIAQSLADVICRSLPVAVAYVRLGKDGANTIDAAGCAAGAVPQEQVHRIGKVVQSIADSGNERTPVELFGDHPLYLSITPIGFDSEFGSIAVGSRERDFPSSVEQLLLSVPANQAAVVLQQRETQAALRDSEALFRSVADNAPAALWMTDATGACTYLSQKWYEFTGRTPAQDLGEGWLENVHPDDVAQARRIYLDAHQRHIKFSIDYRLRCHDGEYRWAVDAGHPRFDGSGRFLGFVGVVIDVHESKLSEEKLKDADRRKDEFLATLAHELRNPLAPVLNSVAVIRQSGSDRGLIDRATAIMDRQLSHMVRLIDDLLDAARITTGKLDLRKARVELATVLLNAVEANRPLIDQMGHELKLTLPPTTYLYGDPVRLTQVISNLINNAAKYTDQGGLIVLAATQEGNDAVITIKDSGVGIEGDMQKRIFDTFAQVDRSLTRSQGGLGLGLTLVKQLIELHGGTVSVHSDGPGTGSKFTIRLPVAHEQDAADVVTNGRVTKSLARLSVLIVDDNLDAAESLATILRLQGHAVMSASEGHEALRIAESKRPEAVILDIGLPGLDGYEVARHIRKQPWGASMLLVAVSGWGQSEDKRRSVEAGLNHHLVKPVNPFDIEQLIAEHGASISS